MVTCPEVREYLNRSGARIDSLSNLPPEISTHLTSCTSCLSDRRVAWMHRPEAVAAPLPERRIRPVFWTALLAAVAAAIWLLVRSGIFGPRP